MLIVDMPMPKRCGGCPCRHVEFDIDRVAVFCSILDNEFVDDPDSIPSWCPIKGELVRCGECKNFTKIDGYCPYYDSYFPADHICEHGERKDGEHDKEP